MCNNLVTYKLENVQTCINQRNRPHNIKMLEFYGFLIEYGAMCGLHIGLVWTVLVLWTTLGGGPSEDSRKLDVGPQLSTQ